METLESAIRALFPNGYLTHEAYSESIERRPGAARRGATPRVVRSELDLTHPPCQATDLFAIAAFLLQRSGGYHHISPEVSSVSSPRMVIVRKTERNAWKSAGKTWRGDGKTRLPAPPAALTKAWDHLMRCRGLLLYRERGQLSAPRPWWKSALALLAIADEAARDIGFETGSGKSAQALAVEYVMRRRIKNGRKVFTLSLAEPDHVCVLPKSRTPKVGCTLRSLSHNLALLPARGLARAYWSPHPELREDDGLLPVEAPFNLVVVPAPFAILARAFSGSPAGDASWGWFHVAPHWCPASGEEDRINRGFEDFWRFISAILDKAAEDVGVVHGLVFPEVALSHDVFRKLCDRLKDRAGFELIVAGLFDSRVEDDEIREGNFAGMARLGRKPGGDMEFDFSTREKHHRWRIEKSQIEAYALGAALDANLGWWEQIDILSRSLDVFVLRGGATVTTLICEDLARNDPCQELVRGVGPNLVIALLMDGPQLGHRWPARYATVLAEDPGSSVLTITSRGLIGRANASGQFAPSDKIALWRDDSGRTAELALPVDAQGLCLTLQPSALRERTLDGRDDKGDAQSWKLTGIMPVKIEAPNAEIMSGRWPGDD